MVKVSLRLAVALLVVLAVVAVSAIIISLQNYYATGVALDLGNNHANSLSQIALAKTERYFDEMAQDAFQMSQVVKRPGFVRPADDPDPDWYLKWHHLMEAVMKGANYSYVHIFGVFDDESVVRCKAFPRGPGLSPRVLSSYIWNPYQNESFELQHYISNGSLVPDYDKEPYRFKNLNGTRFPLGVIGEAASNGNRDPYWLPISMVAFPSEVIIITGLPLRNGTDDFIGQIVVVRTFEDVTGFLMETFADGPIEAFLVDNDGLMIGTTMPEMPAYVQEVAPSRDGLFVDEYCAVSPPTDPVVTLTCRTHVDKYSVFPGLKQEYYESIGSVYPTPNVQEEEIEGKGYFVVKADVKNMHPNRFGIRLFVFYPKSHVLSGLDEAQVLTVTLGIVTAVVAAIVAVIVTQLLLKPLTVLAADMKNVGSLRLSASAFQPSVLSEIDDLQRSFNEMNERLLQLKKFVPHALMHNEGSGSTASVTESMATASVATFEGTPLPPHSNPLDHQDSSVANLDSLGADQSDSDDDDGKRLGVNRKKVASQTNHFYSKTATVLSLQLHNVPDDSESLTQVCNVVLPVFVEFVISFHGVIDRMSPSHLTASFNAHNSCIGHEKKGFKCANGIMKTLSEARSEFRFSIVVDTSTHLVGAVGHGMHSSLSMVGEASDLLSKIHNLALNYHSSSLLVTERVVAGAPKIKVRPVDVVYPTWSQPSRKNVLVVYEPTSKSVSRGLRAIFSLLLTGRLANAEEALLAEKKLVADDPRVDIMFMDKLIDECRACIKANRNTFGRKERAMFEERSSHSLPVPAQLKLQQRKEIETGELPRAISDAIARETATEFNEDGLFGFFVPPSDNQVKKEDDVKIPGVSGAAESNDSGTDLLEPPRVVRDLHETEWHRSDLLLGSGAQASVYKGIGPRGAMCAIKLRRITADTEVADLQHELEIVTRMTHENLVSYHSCMCTQGYIALIMEFVAGGTIRFMSETLHGIPSETLKRNSRDILSGLSALHSHGIVHCDLKPDNVLVTGDGVCKLCDFGTALAAQMSCTSVLHLRGTAAYMAPEVAQGHSPTEASDIWSFGVMLVELATGQAPWGPNLVTSGARSEALFIERIGKESLAPYIPDTIRSSNHEMIGLAELCLVRDPQKRPTVVQLLAHPSFI